MRLVVRRSFRSRTASGVLAVGILLLARTGFAADRMVAVVWSRAQRDGDALLRRVRGQLSDLNVALESVTAPRAAALGEELEEADAIARERGANVVVWFEPLPDRAGVLVIVAQTAGGRVLVRRLESKGRASSSGPGLDALDSATLESASLIVRTSLRALAEGAVIGIAREDLTEVPAPAPSAPPEEQVRPALPPPLPSPPPAVPLATAAHERAAVEWLAYAGWQATKDGGGLQQGLAMHLGARVGRWSFGVSAVQSFGEQIASPYATIVVSRDAFAAFVDLAWLREPEFSASVALSAGAVLFPRATVSTPPGVSATPAQLNPTYAAGFELPLRWSPRPFRRRLSIWLAVGADILPAAPSLGYDLGASFVPVARLWTLQPRAGWGIEVCAF